MDELRPHGIPIDVGNAEVLWPQHGPIFFLAPEVKVFIGDHSDDTAEWKGPIVGNEGASCVLEQLVSVAQLDFAGGRGAGKILRCVELMGYGDAWHWDSVARAEFV